MAYFDYLKYFFDKKINNNNLFKTNYTNVEVTKKIKS